MAGTLNPWLKAQSDELPGQLGQDFTKRGSPPLSVVRCPLSVVRCGPTRSQNVAGPPAEGRGGQGLPLHTTDN